MSLRIAAFLFVSASLGSACAGELCDDCDPNTQYCQVSGGCGLFFGGGLNVDGLSKSYRCFDLPEDCAVEPSCECMFCGPAESRTDECDVEEIVCTDENIVTQHALCE